MQNILEKSPVNNAYWIYKEETSFKLFNDMWHDKNFGESLFEMKRYFSFDRNKWQVLQTPFRYLTDKMRYDRDWKKEGYPQKEYFLLRMRYVQISEGQFA